MAWMEPALSLRLVGHKKGEGDRKAKGRSSMRGFSTISGSYNKVYEFRERAFSNLTLQNLFFVVVILIVYRLKEFPVVHQYCLGILDHYRHHADRRHN